MPILIKKSMDIEFDAEDVKRDLGLESQIRLALQLSNNWWASDYSAKCGGGVFDLYQKGKINEAVLRKIKEKAEQALKFLKNECDSYTITAEKKGGIVSINVEVIQNKKVSSWKFQQ